jgi:two-component system, LuxR family, sensor kinase FixL
MKPTSQDPDSGPSRPGVQHDLLESAMLYRSLVAAMSEGVCVQTADHEVVAVNPAAERILGQPSAKLLGQLGLTPLQDAVHGDGSPFPADLQPAAVALTTGRAQAGVTMGFRAPNGSRTWISVNSQPLIADGQATPYAVVTTFNDITEKRHDGEELAGYRQRYRQHLLEVVEQRTAELRSSENRYRFLFRNMQEGLAHCRMIFRDGAAADFEFLEVNPAFETVTGLHDVVGRRMTEVVPGYGHSNDDSLSLFACVVRTGEPAQWERYFAAIHKWFSVTAYRPAENEFVFVVVDISERKRALAELQASEDRLRLAKTAAGLGIFDWDMVSRTGEWDDLARSFWGIGTDETATFDTFINGVHPDDRAVVQATVERALNPGGSGEFCAEYRVVNRADGGVRYVEANGKVFFEGGRAMRLIGTVEDVSAQKLADAEAQAWRAELERLAKQQVAAHTAAAIAHELNQPLVSISAYSEAALRILRGGSKNPEKLMHALEGAAVQAQRAGHTLHELLDFLHKGEVVSESVDLNQIVREAVGIAEEGGYGGFTPVVELEPKLPAVQANRAHMQKVMVNLLHNGVEAMRSAGVPSAAIVITVRTAADHSVAQVTVRDSGPGLDAETVHRIFEPFFTTKPSGIGLGLAISRALVEVHGGQLWADLDSGPGATFHFTVPFAS